jgi:hypothetical protein
MIALPVADMMAAAVDEALGRVGAEADRKLKQLAAQMYANRVWSERGDGKAGIAFDAGDTKPPYVTNEQTASGLVVVKLHSDAERAQAYALRVWSGQSIDAPRAWRIERVKLALEGQNLPFEGVVLP